MGLTSYFGNLFLQGRK